MAASGLRRLEQHLVKQKVYEQRISLNERLAECSYGNPKRRISEIMSDTRSLRKCVTTNTGFILFSMQVVTFYF